MTDTDRATDRPDRRRPDRRRPATDDDPAADPTPPRPPRSTGPVKYKGEELDAERGPGLGCFRFQLVVLGVLLVLTPLTVVWKWPES